MLAESWPSHHDQKNYDKYCHCDHNPRGDHRPPTGVRRSTSSSIRRTSSQLMDLGMWDNRYL